VAFADTGVLSRSYATRLREHVDQDRELIALGAVNAASGVFQGFPLSSSSSRTPVAEAAGARTQLTGVVGAVGVTTLLVGAPGLLADLPQAALAAIVIAAVLNLLDARWLRRTYRVRRSEFVLAAASLLGVVVLGVLYGVAAAVALSLLNFVRRAWRPNDAVLGRVDGLKGYHDVSRHPSARQVPGLLVFRFDSPLFFANAEWFRDRVLTLVDTAGRPVRRVLIAAEPMTDVDLTAAEVLRDLHAALAERGVELAFAEMKDPVRERLERYGLMDLLGRERFHPTMGTAVRDHVDAHRVAWTDWEDPAAE
jgi:MFS superfamily sulfate permease-like transporter